MGEFEQLVLLAILRLEGAPYGMEIREEIEGRTGRDVSYGAVYTTLDRLEKKGYVTFTMGDVTPERGGRAKKHFSITGAGKDALRSTQRALSIMWEGVTL